MRNLLALIVLCNSFLLVAQITPSICVQTLKGEIRDKITNELLPNSIIVLSDQDGRVIESQFTKEDAQFLFKLECNKDHKIEGRKGEYTTEFKLFTTSDEPDKVLKIVILLGKGKMDFITYNKEVKTAIKNIKVDGIPKISPNIIEQPPVIAQVVEATSKEVSKSNNDISSLEIAPIYFDLGSSYLSTKAKTKLHNIVTLMKKNPKIVVECAAYSDAQGTLKYNQWISDRRAKRTIDFIIKRGIDPHRITGRGFADKVLVNKCVKNVVCKEEEHAANRRADFVIVKIEKRIITHK